jgi:NodT family efflux transporter outer membrane factor (OMF) lipoprotein
VNHQSSSDKPKRTGRLIATVCLVSVVALFSSCVVGPKGGAPTVPLKPLHNAAPIEARKVTAPAPALDTWWTGFGDVELTKVVERALTQNLDLAASASRIEQARAAAKAAGAKMRPAGFLNAQSSSFRQSVESPVGRYATLFPNFDRNQSYLDLGVSATWEIDLFGGLRRGVEAATAELQVAEAEGLGTRISVAAEAGDAYMQVRGAQLRLDFAARQIATDDHLRSLVAQRRTAGIASDRELAQAEALLEEARASVPPLEIVLEAQLNRLDVLVGSQPGTFASELAVVRDVPPVPAIAGFTELSALMRRRPDIIAAERRLAASNARIGQALAEYYPKLSLSALLGNQAINVGDLFREKTFQPTAVAGLRWRLFDFGRVDAEVKQARGAHAEAMARYRNTLLQATEDVEDSFFTLVHLEARQQELLRQISSLQRVRDRSQEAYQAGVIPLTDVLDADRQLLVAQDEMAATRENAARAAIASFRALGGGWRP